MTITEYKDYNNLTHKEMANKLHLSLLYYYKIISGERKPSRKVITYIRKNIPEIDINIFLN